MDGKEGAAETLILLLAIPWALLISFATVTTQVM
jgi:hypothetical protein